MIPTKTDPPKVVVFSPECPQCGALDLGEFAPFLPARTVCHFCGGAWGNTASGSYHVSWWIEKPNSLAGWRVCESITFPLEGDPLPHVDPRPCIASLGSSPHRRVALDLLQAVIGG